MSFKFVGQYLSTKMWLATINFNYCKCSDKIATMGNFQEQKNSHPFPLPSIQSWGTGICCFVQVHVTWTVAQHCVHRGREGKLYFRGGKALLLGEQGWHSGESTRLPMMWPRFKSWHQRHVGWVCCWFSPLLPEVFLRRGYSGFPLSSKTNIFKFHFD